MPAKAGIQRGVKGRSLLFLRPKPPRLPARLVSHSRLRWEQALRGNDENAIALAWPAPRAAAAGSLQ